jgi:hypothetical protein
MNGSKSVIAAGVILCLLLSSLTPLILPGNARAHPADSPWPMFGQNPQRTGQSPYTGPEMPYLKWRFTIGDWVDSSPAIGADGTAWSSDDSCDKAAPDIIGPPHGILVPHRSAPDLCGNEPFIIRWVHQCDACRYEIQIALDRDFTELVEASRLRYEPPDKADPGYVVEGGELRCGITYYWRIRSVEIRAGQEVRSCWSPSRTVTVDLLTGAGVRLVSPAVGATNMPRTNISFTWNMSTTVDSYSFVLSRNADFSDPSETKEGLTNTAYTFTGTLRHDTAYYWKVTAIKDGVPMSLALGTFRTRYDPPPPPPVVGVKADQWITVEYTVTGWSADQPYPEWLKLEFMAVEGASADVRVTMRMSDGTEEADIISVHIGQGGGKALGLSGFVIPSGLTAGDIIYITGYDHVTIEGETMRPYAGANRAVVYATVSQHDAHLTYYWDKQTGVLVEITTTHADTTSTARAAETNMWDIWEVTIWLLTPRAGATRMPTVDVAFDWRALAAVDSFDLVLSRNADLSSHTFASWGLLNSRTSCFVTLDYGTTYYWQVTAWRNGVKVGQSDTGTFTTLPPPEVGIKAGDYIKMDYEITGWPADQPHPDWMKLEFVTVEGTSADVRVTMRMSDGTEETDTVPVEVGGSTGASGLSGFIIPANSEVGDSIAMGGFGFTLADTLLEGETMGTYAGANRTAVYTSFSQYGVDLTYHWDKQTGVMVEASTVHGNMTMTATASGTNIWKADHRGPPWWLWVIVAAAAGVAVVIYLKKRRYTREPRHNEDG